MKTLLNKTSNDPMTLLDYLRIGNIYYSTASSEKEIWEQLVASNGSQKINFESSDFKRFLNSPSIQKLQQVGPELGLPIYLGYYVRGLEDVRFYLNTLSVQDQINKGYFPKGFEKLSYQEQLARTSLRNLQIDTAIDLFSILGAGVDSTLHELDTILR